MSRRKIDIDTDEEVVLRPKTKKDRSKPEPEEFEARFILKYNEDEVQFYWDLGTFTVKRGVLPESLRELKYEVELYNKQIAAIGNGTAPACCYKNKHSDHRREYFADPFGDIEKRFYFYIGAIADVDWMTITNLGVLDLEDTELDHIEKLSCKNLWEILEDPYTGEEFSIGYGILPKTEELFSAQKAEEEKERKEKIARIVREAKHKKVTKEKVAKKITKNKVTKKTKV